MLRKHQGNFACLLISLLNWLSIVPEKLTRRCNSGCIFLALVLPMRIKSRVRHTVILLRVTRLYLKGKREINLIFKKIIEPSVASEFLKLEFRRRKRQLEIQCGVVTIGTCVIKTEGSCKAEP